MQKYEFVYKSKHYEFDLRFSIPNSNYFWENLEQILHQHQIQLIDNQDDTNFSDDSINDFISYLTNPNADILNKKNIYTFKLLNTKYKVKELQQQVDDFIQKHKFDLIVSIISEEKNIDDVDIDDIKIVVDRLFEFISDDDDKKSLLSLPIPFIERILHDYRIKYPDTEIDNERKIMNFFIEYFGLHGEPSSILFQYINFEKVGSECLFKIMSNYPETFDFSCIPINVLKTLCFSYTKRSPSQNLNKIKIKSSTNDKTMSSSINKHEKKKSLQSLQSSTGKEFNGILRYLINQTGNNIHDNGTIEITTNSVYDEYLYHPKCLVDYQDVGKFYYSDNICSSLICFDFKSMSIMLSSYSIKSYNTGSNKGHLKNWVIEASNDKKNWNIIDRRTNDPSLNGSNITKIFNVNQPRNEFYRFIQLRQTGQCWFNDSTNYHIYFQSIEFFGNLKQSSQQIISILFDNFDKSYLLELKKYSNQFQINFNSFIEKLQSLSNKENKKLIENEYHIIKEKILDLIKEYNSNLDDLLNTNDKNDKLLFINKCRKLNNLSHNEYLKQLAQDEKQYGLKEINCVTFKYIDLIDLQFAFVNDVKPPFVFKNDPESNDGTQNMFFKNDVYTFDELVYAKLETYFNGFIGIHKNVYKVSFNPYNINDPKIDQLSNDYVSNKLEKPCLIFGNKYKLKEFIDVMNNYVYNFNQLIKVFDDCSFEIKSNVVNNLRKIEKLMDEIRSILNVTRSDGEEIGLNEVKVLIDQFLEIINLISSYVLRFLDCNKYLE